jgi:hypothetical protein
MALGASIIGLLVLAVIAMAMATRQSWLKNSIDQVGIKQKTKDNALDTTLMGIYRTSKDMMQSINPNVALDTTENNKKRSKQATKRAAMQVAALQQGVDRETRQVERRKGLDYYSDTSIPNYQLVQNATNTTNVPQNIQPNNTQQPQGVFTRRFQSSSAPPPQRPTGVASPATTYPSIGQGGRGGYGPGSHGPI